MADECKCKLATAITLSCMVGLLLSTYALHVEKHAEEDDNYEALCDISEHISCTKVFTSKYGKGFGIMGQVFGENSFWNQPNGLLGMLFYSLIAVLGFTDNLVAAKMQLVLAGLSNLLSLYLAYLLYFVLEDFCVVCVATYVVNFINLILCLKRYRMLMQDVENKKKQKTN